MTTTDAHGQRYMMATRADHVLGDITGTREYRDLLAKLAEGPAERLEADGRTRDDA